MTENVIQGNFDKSTDKEQEMLDLILDKSAPSHTSAYQMIPVCYVTSELASETDLATGGNRSRRWGAQFSVGVLPNLDKSSGGNLTLPEVPAIFIDADSLESLRERLIYELDKAITIAKVSQEDPTILQNVSAKAMQLLGAQEE